MSGYMAAGQPKKYKSNYPTDARNALAQYAREKNIFKIFFISFVLFYHLIYYEHINFFREINPCSHIIRVGRVCDDIGLALYKKAQNIILGKVKIKP